MSNRKNNLAAPFEIFFFHYISLICFLYCSVTVSPKTTTKSVHTGIAQLNNPFLNRQNQGVQQTGIMPHYGGGAEKCARCSKSVYLAEKKVGAGRVSISISLQAKYPQFLFLLVLSFTLL
jgi:hypothetical protein